MCLNDLNFVIFKLQNDLNIPMQQRSSNSKEDEKHPMLEKVLEKVVCKSPRTTSAEINHSNSSSGCYTLSDFDDTSYHEVRQLTRNSDNSTLLEFKGGSEHDDRNCHEQNAKEDENIGGYVPHAEMNNVVNVLDKESQNDVRWPWTYTGTDCWMTYMHVLHLTCKEWWAKCMCYLCMCYYWLEKNDERHICYNWLDKLYGLMDDMYTYVLQLTCTEWWTACMCYYWLVLFAERHVCAITNLLQIDERHVCDLVWVTERQMYATTDFYGLVNGICVLLKINKERNFIIQDTQTIASTIDVT